MDLLDGSDAPAPTPPLGVSVTIEPGPGGVGVSFVVTATNQTDAPLTLTFRTGQSCDVTVTAADGTFIWRWAAGRMFTQAIREVFLEPGHAREVRLDWREAPTVLLASDAPWVAWVNWVSDPGGSAGPVMFGPDLPVASGAATLHPSPVATAEAQGERERRGQGEG